MLRRATKSNFFFFIGKIVVWSHVREFGKDLVSNYDAFVHSIFSNYGVCATFEWNY